MVILTRETVLLIVCSLIATTGCGEPKGTVKQTRTSYRLLKEPHDYSPAPRLQWSGSYVVAQYFPASRRFWVDNGLLLTLGSQSPVASVQLPPGNPSVAILGRDAVVISPGRGKGVKGYRLPTLQEIKLPSLPAWDVFAADEAGMLVFRSREGNYELLVYRHADGKIWRIDCKGHGLKLYGFKVTGDRAVLSGEEVVKKGSQYEPGDRMVTQLWSLGDEPRLLKNYSHDDHAYGSWQRAVLLGDKLYAFTTDFGKYQIADLSTGTPVYAMDTRIPESEFRDGHGAPFRLIGGRWAEATGRFLGLEYRTGSKTKTLISYDVKTGSEIQRRPMVSADVDDVDVVVCFDGMQWNAMLDRKGQARQVVSVADINCGMAVITVPPPSDYSLLYTGRECVIVTPDGFAEVTDLSPKAEMSVQGK